MSCMQMMSAQVFSKFILKESESHLLGMIWNIGQTIGMLVAYHGFLPLASLTFVRTYLIYNADEPILSFSKMYKFISIFSLLLAIFMHLCVREELEGEEAVQTPHDNPLNSSNALNNDRGDRVDGA